MSVPIWMIRVDHVELCARIEADGNTDQQIATLSHTKTGARFPLEILHMIRTTLWRSNSLTAQKYWLRLRRCGQDSCDTRSHLPLPLRARLEAVTAPDPEADWDMCNARIRERERIENVGIELHERTLQEIAPRAESFTRSCAVSTPHQLKGKRH